VTSLIHKQICMAYRIATNEHPWLYSPQPVVTFGDVKILWDVDISTDTVISAHRPDIVIHNGSELSATLIEVTVPADMNIVDKSKKDPEVRLELQKIWNLRSIKFIPILIAIITGGEIACIIRVKITFKVFPEKICEFVLDCR